MHWHLIVFIIIPAIVALVLTATLEHTAKQAQRCQRERNARHWKNREVAHIGFKFEQARYTPPHLREVYRFEYSKGDLL